MSEYLVNLLWDAEAAVWIAVSDDVPGLVLESGSLDTLIERVRFTIPALLNLNEIHNNKLSIYFKSERHEQVYV